jgi:hypothetical protein
MCMTFAASALGTAIIATDQRHSLKLTTGECITSDHGGKLLRLGDSWLALTGDSLTCDAIVRALEEFPPADLGALVARLQQFAPKAADAVRTTWPGLPTDGRVLTLAVSGAAVVTLDGTGLILNASQNGTIITSYPVGITRRLQVPTHMARTRFDLVRMAAADFAEVALLSEAVSATIEVGLGADYLSGRADELAQASDRQILSLLGSAPAPRFDAFTQIIREHVTL